MSCITLPDTKFYRIPIRIIVAKFSIYFRILNFTGYLSGFFTQKMFKIEPDTYPEIFMKIKIVFTDRAG